MSSIRIDRFLGEIPRYDARLLPENNAQSAINCDLQSGKLRPLKTSNTITTPSKTGVITSIYKWVTFWFHWTTDVDVVRSPIAGDTLERVYFTGDGVPKMTFSPDATSGGGTDYPTVSFNLGVPAPASALTAALVVNTGSISGATQANPVVITATAHGRATGDQVDLASVGGMTELNGRSFNITVIDANSYSLDGEDGTGHTAYTSGGAWTQTYDSADVRSRAYVYTYVSASGEEGPPSAVSNIVDVGPGQQVNLTGMAVGPSGSYDMQDKYIYRAEDGDYQYTGQVLLAISIFSDTVAEASLGEILPSTYWVAPPSDLQGLIMLPNGVAVGFTGKDLYFSEPYQPHAWPVSYRKTTNYDIVAISAVGLNVVVTTVGVPYMASGIDPSAIILSKVELMASCVSKRSMVDMGTYALYAGPDGLVAIGAGVSTIVTRALFDPEDWAALVPSSIHSYLWEGRYVGFYDTGSVRGGFIFDPRPGEEKIVFIDDYATAGYYDKEGGDLYLIENFSSRLLLFGDEKGAWMADTAAETITGANLIRNGELWKGASGSTPPTFWTQTDSLVQFSVAGDNLMIDRNGAGPTNTEYVATTVVGLEYIFRMRIISNDGLGVVIQVTGGTTINDATLGVRTIKFTATSTSTAIRIRPSGSSVQTIVIADAQLNLAWSDDVSDSADPLMGYGAIVKSPVAADAELMGYSNFSGGAQLLTNGDFPSNIASWTDYSSGTGSVAWNAGGWMDLTSVDGSNRGMAYQSVTTVVGNAYFLRFKHKDSNLLSVYAGTSAGATDLGFFSAAPSGHSILRFTATTTTTFITLLGPTTAVTTGVDDVYLHHVRILEQPYNPDMDVGTSDFCFAQWVKSDHSGAGDNGVIMQRSDWKGDGWGTSSVVIYDYYPTTDRLIYTVIGTSSRSTVFDLNNGAYRFVVLLRRSGTAYLYVDGVLIDSWASTASITLLRATTRYGIGAWNTSHVAFSGEITLPRFFAYAPTAAQIQEIYATESPMFLAGGKFGVTSSLDIVDFNKSNVSKSLTWKSKKFYAPGANFSAGKVEAAAYPVTMKLIADGVTKHTETVASDNPFRMPGGYRSKECEIELSGTQEIKSVTVAGSMRELSDVVKRAKG